MRRQPALALGMLLLVHAATAQFVQQDTKLVGTGAVGGAQQGFSVALSADGNTAIVGGWLDNALAGAAWVFTRSGGEWSQQGSKLVGTDAVGKGYQGYSVALSADGNTAIIGGPFDNPTSVVDGYGAAWVFTRSGGVWSQQGSKLVGESTVGRFADQGYSVTISADGNTAIIGGPKDDSYTGAAWVFTRTGGAWSQQGGKLVGSGAVGASAEQGTSVAISGDGNTAIVGGPIDNGRLGAAWVFARTGGVWSQQGSKLVGEGTVGRFASQGNSVAISADGSTAIVGGFQDNAEQTYPSGTGAAWVFARSGGVWTQQGSKLVGTGAVGAAAQGFSVAISADGNTAIVGGPEDNYFSQRSGDGAAWVFRRSGAVWSQLGSKLVGMGAVGPDPATQGWSVAISADGGTAIVGGLYDDSSAGAAWVFSASAFKAWVPVASHNPGKNDSQWRSDLGLLNTGTTTANAQITFHWNTGHASNTTYVPPGAQAILTDVVGQLGGSGSGALEILSDQPLKLTARTYNQVPAGASCYANGTQGQDYPAVSPSGGLGTGQSAYLAGLAENAAYRSNIGVVDVGSDPATVLVELFDGAGTKLTDYLVGLAVGQWAQETQPFFSKAGQSAMDRGYARITVQSGSGVFAFASVIDNLTNDPTTVAIQR